MNEFKEELELMEMQNAERVVGKMDSTKTKSKKRVLVVYPEPNVESIEIGETFKNYKAMCDRFGEKYRTSDSKKAQVKNWERYFSFSKEGNKLTITDIFDIPKERVDYRSEGGNNVKYLGKIEDLILNLLSQEENAGKVFLSRNKLLTSLSMVNENYVYGKYNSDQLSEYTSINRGEIDDFYTTTDGVLKRNINSALINLKKKSLIFYSEVMTVAIADVEAYINKDNMLSAKKTIKTDTYGNDSTHYEPSDIDVEFSHRKATTSEINSILRVTKEIMDDYGYELDHEPFINGTAKDFYKRIDDRLFKEHNIDMHYFSYEIYFNHDHVQKERAKLEDWNLQEGERILSMIDLNKDIIDRLLENVERRSVDSIEMFDKTEKDKYRNRMSEYYVENSNILIGLLVAYGADLLKEKLLEMKKKDM